MKKTERISRSGSLSRLKQQFCDLTCLQSNHPVWLRAYSSDIKEHKLQLLSAMASLINNKITKRLKVAEALAKSGKIDEAAQVFVALEKLVTDNEEFDGCDSLLFHEIHAWWLMDRKRIKDTYFKRDIPMGSAHYLNEELPRLLVVEDDRPEDHPNLIYIKGLLADTKMIFVSSHESMTFSALKNHRDELVRAFHEYADICSIAKTSCSYLKEVVDKHQQFCDKMIALLAAERKERNALLPQIRGGMDSLEQEINLLMRATSGSSTALLHELTRRVTAEAKTADSDYRKALEALIKQTHLIISYPGHTFRQKNYNQLLVLWQDKNPSLADVMRQLMRQLWPISLVHEPVTVSPPFGVDDSFISSISIDSEHELDSPHDSSPLTSQTPPPLTFGIVPSPSVSVDSSPDKPELPSDSPPLIPEASSPLPSDVVLSPPVSVDSPLLSSTSADKPESPRNSEPSIPAETSSPLPFNAAMALLNAKAKAHTNARVKQRLNALITLISNEYNLKKDDKPCVADLEDIVNRTLVLMAEKPSDDSFVRYCRRATEWSNQYKSSSAKFIAKAMLAVAVAIIIGAAVVVPMFSAMVVAVVAAIGASSSLVTSGFFGLSDTPIARKMRSFEKAREEEWRGLGCGV